jgi:hypothetical protein
MTLERPLITTAFSEDTQENHTADVDFLTWMMNDPLVASTANSSETPDVPAHVA